LEGVAEIETEFHDGRKWQSEWTDRRAKTLPRVVRISITVVDENNREHQFGTAIPVVCRSAIVRDKSEQKIESAQR
jgi:Type II secretion system (T2SS), protein J